MFEFDINLCKNCDLRATQRVPISKFSWGGGACPQTPLGGHAYTCHGLTPGIHHSLVALQGRTLTVPLLKVLLQNCDHHSPTVKFEYHTYAVHIPTQIHHQN